MAEGAEQSRPAELVLWAHDARARSRAYAAQAGQAAESAAVMRDQAEHMVEHLAERHPQQTERLHAIRSTAARQRAAIAACKHRFYAGQAGGQPLPDRGNEPGAAAFSPLDIYRRGMAVVQERERIAGELAGNVIQRVFAAGLTLEGASGLATEPEMRQRIEEAADGLDTVIRAIRDAVFNLPRPMSG